MKLKFMVMTNIKHGVEGTPSRTYEPGEIIELTPEEAAGIPWAIKAIVPSRRPLPSKEAAE